jgi:hypothetical protein
MPPSTLTIKRLFDAAPDLPRYQRTQKRRRPCKELFWPIVTILIDHPTLVNNTKIEVFLAHLLKCPCGRFLCARKPRIKFTPVDFFKGC